MEILLASISAVAALLIFFALVPLRRVDPLQSRLDTIARLHAPTLEELELQKPLFDRTVRPLLAHMAALASRLSTQKMAGRTDERLARAGHPGGLRAVDFLAIRLVLPLLVGLVVFFLFVVVARAGLMGTLTALLGGIVGYVAPEFWLRSKINARRDAVTVALPDTLDLLTISVRAGLGFDSALAKVVEKMRGPLADELRRALAEIRVGKPRRDALRDMAARVQLPTVNNLVGAIVQAEQLGVPIGKVLQVQSEQMRIERRQRAEEAAAKAPVKMLFPLIGCVFPTLFLVIIGPAIIGFSQRRQ
ncbi:MAG: type II secretion system F family protein [Chloroflexota bacterium]|nr:type II secretion system F family protein [Chloroflexota bacterium]